MFQAPIPYGDQRGIRASMVAHRRRFRQSRTHLPAAVKRDGARGPRPEDAIRLATRSARVRTSRAVAVDTGAVTHSEADAAYDARAWQRAFELYDGTP